MMRTDNYDPLELEKFNVGNWWDNEHGPYALLHQLNPQRLAFVAAQTDLTNKKVLDLGCGGGILSEALAKAGAEVTAVDLNEQALNQAINHAKQNDVHINYVCAGIECFAESHKAQFDLVTCMEMLEHVPDPESIIASVALLLKPSGIAVFSTINRNLRAYLEAIIMAEYFLNLLPRGTHSYEKLIKPSELCAVARKNGLALLDLKGLQYQLLHKKFILSSAIHTNYLVAFKKMNVSLNSGIVE